MKTTRDSNQFRRFLVNLLTRTHWAKTETDPNVLAPRLGLQPDVIVEARALQNRRHSIETCAFTLQMPKSIFEYWNRTSEAQQAPGALLLRGLIQVLLSQAKLPTWTGKSWFFRGKRVALSGIPHGKNWPWKQKTLISRGADRALAEIATHHKTTKTGLVRGHVIDYLEGRAPRLILISSEQMHSDPRRYTKLWGL